MNKAKPFKMCLKSGWCGLSRRPPLTRPPPLSITPSVLTSRASVGVGSLPLASVSRREQPPGLQNCGLSTVHSSAAAAPKPPAVAPHFGAACSFSPLSPRDVGTICRLQPMPPTADAPTDPEVRSALISELSVGTNIPRRGAGCPGPTHNLPLLWQKLHGPTWSPKRGWLMGQASGQREWGPYATVGGFQS